jgi:hypothetical protein
MAATGILAPNVKWYVFTKCGTPAVGGRFLTFDAITGIPKPTYADPGLIQPNPVDIGIGSDGAVMANLYWAVGEDENLYTVRAYDRSGSLIFEFTPYPVVGSSSGGDVTVVNGQENFAENEQFAFWPCGTVFDNDALPIGSTQTATAWHYTRSNDNATLEISQFLFSAGNSTPDFNPKAAARYRVLAPSADAEADFTQRYIDVQTFSNKTITEAMQFATNNIGSTAQVSLIVKQFFGTGGSPTIETIIATFTINDTFDFYANTFTVPNIAGNTIGEGSYLEIGYRFFPEQIQDILFTNAQFQSGQGTGLVYPYITENLQYVKVLPETLAGHCPNTGTDIIGTGSISTPAARSMTETQYLQQSFQEATPQNILIGWNFPTNPRQFGSPLLANNAQYIADQTILLSDGNGVVSQISTFNEPLILSVQISNKKFGIFQIIENANSSMLTNNIQKVASMMVTMSSSQNSTFKMALIGWSGAANSQARNAVAAWNIPGTDPSLATGWNYLNPINPTYFIDSTSNTADFIAENIGVGSGFTSYGVFVWNDSADMLSGSAVIFNQISLTNGINAAHPAALDAGTVLRQCQRYYQRSYSYLDGEAPVITGGAGEVSVLPASTVTGLGDPGESVFPLTVATSSDLFRTSASLNQVQFPVEMWKPPSMTTYNPSTGATGSAFLNVSFSGSVLLGSFNITATCENARTNNFQFRNLFNEAQFSPGSIINYQPDILFHYVADATLGV